MNILAIGEFLLESALMMFVGDRPWWNFSLDGGVYGIGEIGNKVLIYLGDAYWISPFPSGKVWLLGYGLMSLAIVYWRAFGGCVAEVQTE
ncbi:hypothetical protein [Cerasicoccus maritimus]|uniref:hypothetical protein n=1 Tax=Cerasicoccus maritimus TaxID=490089 RepID=UPI002852B34A|nr:hypothetical protein [Cerasicoccus maritimus]